MLKYLDFSKVFDMVSHCHLPVKTKNLGISKKKKIVNCARFFYRTMKVKIGNNYSEIQYTLWCSSGIRKRTFNIHK